MDVTINPDNINGAGEVTRRSAGVSPNATAGFH
jgi:hypothetical protein